MYVDVVNTTSGNDFRCLGKFLMIGAHFAGKVVGSGSIAYFGTNHRRVIITVLSQISHHFSAVFVVIIFCTREIDTQAAVVAAAITFDIPYFIASKLKKEVFFYNFQSFTLRPILIEITFELTLRGKECTIL